MSTDYRPLKTKKYHYIVQEIINSDFPSTLSNRPPKQSGNKNVTLKLSETFVKGDSGPRECCGKHLAKWRTKSKQIS